MRISNVSVYLFYVNFLSLRIDLYLANIFYGFIVQSNFVHSVYARIWFCRYTVVSIILCFCCFVSFRFVGMFIRSGIGRDRLCICFEKCTMMELIDNDFIWIVNVPICISTIVFPWIFHFFSAQREVILYILLVKLVSNNTIKRKRGQSQKFQRNEIVFIKQYFLMVILFITTRMF